MSTLIYQIHLNNRSENGSTHQYGFQNLTLYAPLSCAYVKRKHVPYTYSVNQSNLSCAFKGKKINQEVKFRELKNSNYRELFFVFIF